MNNYQIIKKTHEENYNSIMNQHKVFWAFSKKQLEEGKAEIGVSENSQLTSIGMGGFMPKVNANEMFRLLCLEDARYKKELKEAKQAQEEAILYELNNHESFYTGSIEEVIEKFKGIYTKAEIKKVFIKFNK